MKVVKVLTSEFKRFCSLIFFLISDLKMKKGGGGGGGELEVHAVNREEE